MCQTKQFKELVHDFYESIFHYRDISKSNLSPGYTMQFMPGIYEIKKNNQ